MESYRRGTLVLLVSVILNAVLGFAIVHVYFSQPEHDFYATDGETPPKTLTAMGQPNYSASALLADEQNNNDNSKAVQQ